MSPGLGESLQVRHNLPFAYRRCRQKADGSPPSIRVIAIAFLTAVARDAISAGRGWSLTRLSGQDSHIGTLAAFARAAAAG